MIKIQRSSRYQLWTIYIRGKAVAGLTNPPGVWIGELFVGIARWPGERIRLYAFWKGRNLL